VLGIVYPLLPTGSFSEVITILNQVFAEIAVEIGVFIVMRPDPLSEHYSEGTFVSYEIEKSK
jgi:hypothetical protein